MWFPKNRGKVRKEKMKFYLNDGKKVDMHTEEITDNAYMYIGEITVQVWGGTRKHPKIIGYDTQKGIVKGDFLYFDGGRYKITAHKVVSFKIISD